MPPLPDEAIAQTILGLLRARAATSTICPSEAARVLAPEGWRGLMPRVREVALRMAARGEIVVRQRGRVVPVGVPLRGPIRLGRGG